MFNRKQPQNAASAMGSVPSGSPTKIETVIGPTANFKGTLQSDGGLRIDGMVEGVIQIAGNLIIGESGKVIADITAQNISVAGAIKGTLKAAGRLEILSTGRVWGDIAVSSFLIDEGGFFRGQSIMAGEPDMPMLSAPMDNSQAAPMNSGQVVEGN